MLSLPTDFCHSVEGKFYVTTQALLHQNKRVIVPNISVASYDITSVLAAAKFHPYYSPLFESFWKMSLFNLQIEFK